MYQLLIGYGSRQRSLNVLNLTESRLSHSQLYRTARISHILPNLGHFRRRHSPRLCSCPSPLSVCQELNSITSLFLKATQPIPPGSSTPQRWGLWGSCWRHRTYMRSLFHFSWAENPWREVETARRVEKFRQWRQDSRARGLMYDASLSLYTTTCRWRMAFRRVPYCSVCSRITHGLTAGVFNRTSYLGLFLEHSAKGQTIELIWATVGVLGFCYLLNANFKTSTSAFPVFWSLIMQSCTTRMTQCISMQKIQRQSSVYIWWVMLWHGNGWAFLLFAIQPDVHLFIEESNHSFDMGTLEGRIRIRPHDILEFFPRG